MPFTTLTVNKMLDAAHPKTTMTAPTNVWIGLSTTTPTVAGTNVTEPVGNSYARVSTSTATWGTAAAGSITNAAVIQFPTATAAGWGTVISAPVFDAVTAGNLLWFAAITSQAVAAGVAPSIGVGSATSTLT